MRFTFFGGKGGVGKTTCAAAAAVRAANEGARVLIVSTDPAHSLGDALDARIARRPTAVSLSRSLSRSSTVRGELWAAQLDADRALAKWLRERKEAFRTIADRGTYLDEDDVDRLLDLSLPGVDELVGLVELMRLARTRDYDEIVVDTAPTGHTLRLLEMPETLERLAEVLDDMQAKHRFLAESLSGAWRGDFADDVIAEIAHEAGELRGRLRDRTTTTFTWVTLAEELAVLESARAIEAIEAMGVRVARVVVNRVTPPPEIPCPACGARAHEERRWLEVAARRLARERRPLFVLPATTIEPRGPGALAVLAASLRPFGARPRATGRVVSPKDGMPRDGERERVRARARARDGEGERGGEGARLVLFGGKGGVGKTTAAAGTAVVRARAGERVLLLSTDPAHSLGDAFGVTIGDDPITIERSLVARAVDARAMFEQEKKRYREAIDDLFGSIFRGKMEVAFDRAVLHDLIDLAPPGIDEVFAIVSLTDALFAKPRWDAILVDTAPTGHTLRLLALPDAALAWVHALMAVVLKYRRVIGLGELASDLTAFARRLRALIALLRDRSRATFIAVTRAAELPRIETERLIAELGRLGVPLGAVLVNAVTTGGACERCRAIERAERVEIGKLARVARRARVPLRIAPAVYPPPRGRGALAALRSRWRLAGAHARAEPLYSGAR